jgi:hypothetical protein
LLSNGVCIRYIDVPFTSVRWTVPNSAPLILLAATTVSAVGCGVTVWIESLRHRRMKSACLL